MQPKSLSHLSKKIIQKYLRNSEPEKMLKKIFQQKIITGEKKTHF